jgi:DNA-binding ferritin-like protein
MVVVDDNTHTGTDFKNIFRSVDGIAKRVEGINSKPSENEQEALDTLDKIKAHKSFKSSKHLQDQFVRLDQILKAYRERIDILNRAPNRRRNHFFGYALYLLKDSDLGIKKKSELEKDIVDTDD